MAATGATPISLYYSSTTTNVPTAGNLVAGELAINTADGKLFYKDSSGVVQTMASKATGTVAGTTTQVIYNNAGAYAGSANFVFDGTNVGIGTTSPSSFGQLAVVTSGNPIIYTGSTTSGNAGAIAIQGNGAGSYPSLNFTQTATNYWTIGQRGDTNLYLYRQSGSGIVIIPNNPLQVATTIGVGATPATSGAGISFPANQSASSDANTLDDYEEGTWTPSWTGGITSSNTTYTKIGRVVYVSGQITATGATSGDLSGLPFGSVIDGSDCGSVGYQNVNVSTWNVLKTASTTFRFYAGGTQQQFLISGNNARFAFSYITST